MTLITLNAFIPIGNVTVRNKMIVKDKLKGYEVLFNILFVSGYPERLCQVDFFPNKGFLQPGCGSKRIFKLLCFEFH